MAAAALRRLRGRAEGAAAEGPGPAGSPRPAPRGDGPGRRAPVPESGAPPAPPPRSVSLEPPRRPPAPATSPGRPGAAGHPESAGVNAPAASALSVMDGVPFTLHPNIGSSPQAGARAVITGVIVKSPAEIEREYNYTFVVERTAAARAPSIG